MHPEQHGSYRLWQHDNVLYAELVDTWNDIAAANFSRDFKALASEINGDWGHMVYLDNWDLCSPEMFAIIKELVDWCISHGLKRAANVYAPSAMKKEFLGRMIVEEQGEFKRAHFDCEEKAVTWLRHEGFNATADLFKRSKAAH
ncbi:hypothetical protein [Aestuariibacter salexigens]|uniref:hypothetical protein n=1 Tax=Aestuariibacter salexigens TaxID=226010 RepID=UPI00040C165E|nr:hypothetical protein [Aestuariibacter salexigens]